jgi:hypothetical protein
MTQNNTARKSASKSLRLHSVYLNAELVAAVDDWRGRQEGIVSRSDAIRRMCWRVIKSEGGPLPAAQEAV